MAQHPRSPLAPAAFPAIAPIAGVRFATGAAGIRYKGRTDLLLAELAPGTTVAGALTRSKSRSAPVDWCRRRLAAGVARALVVNAGNANAFTGKDGEAVVRRTAKAAAKLVGCRDAEVFVASTGVIGEPLPVERIVAALPALAADLAADAWAEAAEAIRTTDTFPKGASAVARIGGTRVRIGGIAKGSGMIAPNMGTMLAFIFTDAAVPAGVLQSLVLAATDRTFNCITVDGDTSTSDTVLVFATGQAGHPPLRRASDPALADFAAKLDAVMADLARQVVCDGEGATRFVEIAVTGAASAQAARAIGLSIANSPLVKTAIAGGDPNWGRIVAAVGKAGERANRDKLAIDIGGIAVARKGAVAPGYVEAKAAKHLKGQHVDIAVDVGVGKGSARVWTCDLTHRYIEINADYRS